jgi:hypothetical protein
MKLSKLKSIIREEINREINKKQLDENIVADIIALILTPGVKKKASQLKNSPEWKELEAQTKKAVEELEMISKRLERIHKDQETLAKEAKKLGIKVKPGMTYDDIMAQHPQHNILLKKYKLK